MGDKLLAGLLSHRKGGMCGNTQDHVFGIIGVHALAAADPSSGAPEGLQLWHNGPPIGPEQWTAEGHDMRRLQLRSVERRQHRIKVHSPGDRALNPSLRASFDAALTEDNRRPIARRLQLQRSSQTAEGEPVDPERIELGSLVRVRLELRSEAKQHYLAIEDRLPAGLEPLNQGLETTERLGLGAMDSELARGLEWLSHSELRDHRVLFYADELPPERYAWSVVARATSPGVFLRPAATAEAMSEPDTRARTAIDEVRIQP